MGSLHMFSPQLDPTSNKREGEEEQNPPSKRHDVLLYVSGSLGVQLGYGLSFGFQFVLFSLLNVEAVWIIHVEERIRRTTRTVNVHRH